MMRKSAAVLVASLLGGAAWADLPFRVPVPPANCTDCFGLAARKEERDFSYEPLLTTRPYGEDNCGAVRYLSGTTSPPAALRDYEPFKELAQRTSYRKVVFLGMDEAAIDCMILLARVKQRRLADGVLDPKEHPSPLLYGWKSVFLRFDPRSGRKLVWMSVMPTAAEQTDLTGYLHRSAQKIISSLSTSLADLHAADVHLTIGYREQWVTANVSKQETGLTVNIVPGMELEGRLRTDTELKLPASTQP